MTTQTPNAPALPVVPGTALPWRTIKIAYEQHALQAEGSRDIAMLHNQRDAHYIVTACNAFPALYEALEVCVDELTAFAGCVYHDSVREEIEANIAKARAALAKGASQ